MSFIMIELVLLQRMKSSKRKKSTKKKRFLTIDVNRLRFRTKIDYKRNMRAKHRCRCILQLSKCDVFVQMKRKH